MAYLKYLEVLFSIRRDWRMVLKNLIICVD